MSSNNNHRQHPQYQECGSCRNLLRQVFERNESGPHGLVASMMTDGVLEWRGAEHGIQVKIPTEESRPVIPVREQKWSRHYNNNNNTEAVPSSSAATFGGLVQATSMSRSTTTSLNSPDLQQPSQQQQSPREHSSVSSSPLGKSSAAAAATTEWMNVSCQVCPNVGPQGKARAYVNGPHPLDIVICSNRLRETPGSAAAVQEMEEILTHELVHIYDARQLQLDLRECQNLAYSEVRAAREAECASVPTAFGLQASCVRERALLATQNLFPKTASRACLQKVFSYAMKDARPFGSNSNNTTTGAGTGGQSTTPILSYKHKNTANT